jgi:urea transporter
VCLAGGLVSGVLGYLFAVRRHGPLAMAGLLGGALAAAFVARWVGEQAGLAGFRHLLATLPAGARFHDSLRLGAAGVLGAWALAAAVAAGGLELVLSPGRHRRRR